MNGTLRRSATWSRACLYRLQRTPRRVPGLQRERGFSNVLCGVQTLGLLPVGSSLGVRVPSTRALRAWCPRERVSVLPGRSVSRPETGAWGADRVRQLTTCLDAARSRHDEKVRGSVATLERSQPSAEHEQLRALLQAIRESSSLSGLHDALRQAHSHCSISNEAWASTRKLKRCITVAGAVRAKLATWRGVRWDRPTSACLSEIVEMSVYNDVAPEVQDTLETSAWANALAGWAPWIRWLRPDTVTRLYRSLEQVCAILPHVSTEVYTALWKYRIQALGYLRWPCDLDECLEFCRRHRLRPDHILMNTMLDGFCNGPRGGPLRPAWRNRGSAYTASDEPLEFLRVFLERMLQEWQLRPSTATLNIMLEFLSREGRTKDLIAFYDRWINAAYALGESDTGKPSVEGLIPDLLTFRTLFQALDPRWRPCPDHEHPQCSLQEFCVLADKFLPRLRSHLRNYMEANGLSVTALETALTAQMEAYAYTGKGVEVMELLPEVVVELPRLVVVAIRGLAFNVRAVRLAQYAFGVFETHLRYDKVRQKTLTPELLRSVLDALLVACDRTRNARRALDLFHSFANGEIADTAILASRVGLRALVRAHAKAPAALWPALAECLAIASAEGIRLDADAIHRLEQHYKALGPLASTARDQVQRIMTLMFDLDR